MVLVLGTALLMTSYMAALAGTFSLYSSRVLFAGKPAPGGAALDEQSVGQDGHANRKEPEPNGRHR